MVGVFVSGSRRVAVSELPNQRLQLAREHPVPIALKFVAAAGSPSRS